VAVFQVTGVLVLVGLGVLGYVSLWQRRTLALEPKAKHHIV
jgi:hypothetical protein